MSPLGQPSYRPEVDDDTRSPRSGVFEVLRASSEPDIRVPRSPYTRIHGRLRDSGPDGASDTGPVTGKEREFTPILGQRLSVTAKDDFDVSSPSTGKYSTPERDLANSPSQGTEFTSSKDIPLEINNYNMPSPFLKCAAVSKSEQSENIEVISAERERQRTYVMHAPSERALKQKPLASHKRSAPSPAFSVKSYESDQYSELPTVIHVSRGESSGSNISNNSIPTRTTSQDKDVLISPISTPVSDMRSGPSSENRVAKLASRDKRVTNSSSLPSKPRFDIRAKRVQKS